MKAIYKTPKIKVIKLDAEELLAASGPTLNYDSQSVNPWEKARSKGVSGIIDDSESESE